MRLNWYALVLTVCITFSEADEKDCGLEDLICAGTPRNCWSRGDIRCEGSVDVMGIGAPLVRMEIFGLPRLNSPYEPTPDMWVGVSFSSDGYTNNTATIVCMADKGRITAKLAWNTANHRLQPEYINADQSPLEVVKTKKQTGNPGFSCSVTLPQEFTIRGKVVTLSLASFYTVAIGLIDNNGTLLASQRVETYLATRVANERSDRTYLVWCSGWRTEESEIGCDMKDYNQVVSRTIIHYVPPKSTDLPAPIALTGGGFQVYNSSLEVYLKNTSTVAQLQEFVTTLWSQVYGLPNGTASVTIQSVVRIGMDESRERIARLRYAVQIPGRNITREARQRFSQFLLESPIKQMLVMPVVLAAPPVIVKPLVAEGLRLRSYLDCVPGVVIVVLLLNIARV